jgi:hypothetical protein
MDLMASSKDILLAVKRQVIDIFAHDDCGQESRGGERPAPVAEDKECPALQLLLHHRAHQPRQPLEPLAHVAGFQGHEDPHPILRYHFFAAPGAVCPEPFVEIHAAPGETIAWAHRYELTQEETQP